MERDIPIRGDMIRLGQLLKLAGIVGGGGELKAMLQATPVLVNGEPETRRGRQLHPGDVVSLADERLRVVARDRPNGWPKGQISE
jgi:ribosome-associated protein